MSHAHKHEHRSDSEECEQKKWQRKSNVGIDHFLFFFFQKNHGYHRPLQQYCGDVQHELENESGIRI